MAVESGQPKASRSRPLSVRDIQALKGQDERFAVVAAYDYLTASLIDEAGVPLIPVGDSFGMFALGYESLLPVTLDQMIHHTRAVVSGVSHGVVVADLPFGSYEEGPTKALRSSIRLVKEAGAHAVKLEGGGPVLHQSIELLVSAGIPAMGHLGFTPQAVNQLGGFVLQGRSEEAVEQMIEQARQQQDAGAFALVLERVPPEAGRRVTEAVDIPTIGAGAGPYTDAQVMLLPWLLGLVSDQMPRWFRRPRWAKPYAELRSTAIEALEMFRREVAEGTFPAEEHTYS